MIPERPSTNNFLADFHTELESISSHEQSNTYIRYPIILERYIMEGNYAKVLVEKREKVFDVLFAKVQEAVQTRQQQTRALSSVNAVSAVRAASDMAPLSIISNMVGYAVDLERIV
jgi:PAB1-binding protein PBP1